MSSVLNHVMQGLDGHAVDLSGFLGEVVLIVNVASRCGHTPQYTGLQRLHDRYGKEGLIVLGVPANEFGKQEPGSDAEIAGFCSTNYGVTFPMLAKVAVKGTDTTPLYRQLTSKESNPQFGGDVRWNFTKFLVGRDGSVVGRFEPDVEPESAALTGAIEAELKK